jgi:Sulfate permease family
VAEAAGAQTQLTGVVGALAVALLLLLAPSLLKHLPSAALAAVVVASAIGLFEVADLIRIFRIQPWECCRARRYSGYRFGYRDRGARVLVGRLAPTFSGARPSRGS